MAWQVVDNREIKDDNGRTTGAFVMFSNGVQKDANTFDLTGKDMEEFKADLRVYIAKLEKTSAAFTGKLSPGPIDLTPAPEAEPSAKDKAKSAYLKAYSIAKRAKDTADVGIRPLNDSEIQARISAAGALFLPEYLD